MSDFFRTLDATKNEYDMKRTDISKIPVYYATEENGYERELVGEFDTIEQAREFVNAELKGDDIEDTCGENGWDGVDEEGYVVIYGIGDKGAKHIDYEREVFIEECEHYGEEE